MKAAWMLLIVVACLDRPVEARERVVGGPCDGCEHVFVDMPETL